MRALIAAAVLAASCTPRCPSTVCGAGMLAGMSCSTKGQLCLYPGTQSMAVQGIFIELQCDGSKWVAAQCTFQQ